MKVKYPKRNLSLNFKSVMYSDKHTRPIYKREKKKAERHSKITTTDKTNLTPYNSLPPLSQNICV